MKKGNCLLVFGILFLIFGVYFISATWTAPKLWHGGTNISIMVAGVDKPFDLNTFTKVDYFVNQSKILSNARAIPFAGHNASQIWVSVEDGQGTLFDVLTNKSNLFSNRLCAPDYPKITFSPPGTGGSTAKAVANVSSSGVINSITILSGGSEYGTAPTVTITRGKGTGATAIATVVPGSGAVSAVQVTNGGSGYTPTSYNIPLGAPILKQPYHYANEVLVGVSVGTGSQATIIQESLQDAINNNTLCAPSWKIGNWNASCINPATNLVVTCGTGVNLRMINCSDKYGELLAYESSCLHKESKPVVNRNCDNTSTCNWNWCCRGCTNTFTGSYWCDSAPTGGCAGEPYYKQIRCSYKSSVGGSCKTCSNQGYNYCTYRITCQ